MTATVRYGNVFLIPRGYGPSIAAPDHDLYYLNVLAGPSEERRMAFCDDQPGVDPRRLGSDGTGSEGADDFGKRGSPVSSRRLTTAQALIEFLANQYVERDGRRSRFFAGMFGIFGHGNVAGIGQALQQAGDRLPYYLVRNEQAMVHAAAGFAKMSNRRATFACTSPSGRVPRTW